MENELLQSEIDVVMERLHFYETRASDLNEKIGSLSVGNRKLVEALLMIYSDAKYVLLGLDRESTLGAGQNAKNVRREGHS